VRLVWTIAAALWAQWRIKRGRATAPGDGPLPSWRTGIIVGWAGTRGLVTVATALALPQAFPERGMLLFAAFTVTLGTLLIQGLTLRPLVLLLRVSDDAVVDREVCEARVAMAEAALAALSDEREDEANVLRAELEAERRMATTTGKDDGRLTFPAKLLRTKALAVRRKHLLAMRGAGVIGDEAFHQLEEELDFLDLALATQTYY